jgi:hypothetical protein
MTCRNVERRLDGAAGIPDTRKESVDGFRLMRGRLEREGMPRSDAEDWARLAVGNFRVALGRGLSVAEAYEYNFSETMAADFLSTWKCANPKPTRKVVRNA